MFDYNKVNDFHLVLPAGNLRESFSARARANILVVSKCPVDLHLDEQSAIIKRVGPGINQKLFFTTIDYKPLQYMVGSAAEKTVTKDSVVFLLTGIANPDPMLQHIQKQAKEVIHHNYPDHHQFSLKNITKLADEFKACTSADKMIITTEKDAQRLADYRLQAYVENLDILVLPIGIDFFKWQ